MARVKIGDIFEIKTSKGYIYIHYIFKDEKLGPLIGVLSGFYNKRPSDFQKIVLNEEQFVVYFAISSANKRKTIEYVSNYKMVGFQKPQFMKTEHYIGREFVKTLSPEQKKLSPWGIWSDALLIENLEEEIDI